MRQFYFGLVGASAISAIAFAGFLSSCTPRSDHHAPPPTTDDFHVEVTTSVDRTVELARPIPSMQTSFSACGGWDPDDPRPPPAPSERIVIPNDRLAAWAFFEYREHLYLHDNGSETEWAGTAAKTDRVRDRLRRFFHDDDDPLPIGADEGAHVVLVVPRSPILLSSRP